MDQKENLIFHSRPALRKPYVLCGMDGWVNGGDVSSGSIEYLIRQLKATKFAEMPSSRYHVYQVPGVDNLRPIFRMQEGIITEARFPKDEFYYAKNPGSEHDLVLFLGTEPNLFWEEYTETIAGLAHDFGAARLYSSGGILDRSPYTRQPRISCTCTSIEMQEEMGKYNLTFSSREGPATINQMLLYACNKKGIDGATFTVRVSYYPEFNVAIDYNPKSIKAALLRINHLTHLNLNFDELNKAEKELEDKLDLLRHQNPQFNTYIEELEKEYVEMPFQEPLDISPNEAIRFAEEFLRNNQDKGSQQQ